MQKSERYVIQEILRFLSKLAFSSNGGTVCLFMFTNEKMLILT